MNKVHDDFTFQFNLLFRMSYPVDTVSSTCWQHHCRTQSPIYLLIYAYGKALWFVHFSAQGFNLEPGREPECEGQRDG